jgi:hypothetical protein
LDECRAFCGKLFPLSKYMVHQKKKKILRSLIASASATREKIRVGFFRFEKLISTPRAVSLKITHFFHSPIPIGILHFHDQRSGIIAKEKRKRREKSEIKILKLGKFLVTT